MKIKVELEKEELDAISTLANLECVCKVESYMTCKHCPLYVPKGLVYSCLHVMAQEVCLKYKGELNSMYGQLVTAYADNDSTGEQKDAQSGD